MELKIGCTGWAYQDWIGPLYPRTMPQSQHLKHYASIFDITEVNTTFYNILSQTMTQKWHDNTPDKFVFTAKLPKAITHEGRLKPTPYLDRFLQAMRPLGTKLKTIVIQLPPSLSYKEAKDRLETMLDHLPTSYRYALEARHQSWFDVEVFDYLEKRNVCLVWNEVEGVENPAPITSNFLYLRLIGDRSIPESEFGKILKDRTSEMKKWIEKLKKADVPLAIVVINNHWGGFAPGMVNQFRKLMGLQDLVFADKKQMTLDFK